MPLSGLISSIEPQKKKRNRYSVFIDGEYALGISGYILLKHGLKNGMALTEKKSAEILEDEETEKQWAYVLRILAMSDRTFPEIETKLKIRKAAPGVITAIKERLQRQNLVNDSEYARKYCGYRKGYGYHYLYSKLAAKGVPRDKVKEALAEHFRNAPEPDVAVEFLESNRKKWDLQLTRQERMKKIAGLLKNRGFSDTVIYDMIGRFSRPAEGQDGEDI